MALSLSSSHSLNDFQCTKGSKATVMVAARILLSFYNIHEGILYYLKKP